MYNIKHHWSGNNAITFFEYISEEILFFVGIVSKMLYEILLEREMVVQKIT